jgi:VanZ family protein
MTKENIRQIAGAWIPVLLWMGLIFALSSVSGLKSGLVQGIDLVLRKIAHAAEYGILGALILRALQANGRPTRRRDYALAFLVAALYAVSDEFHQRFVGDRVGAWRDVLIDSVGAMIGLDVRRRWLRMKAR